MISLREKRSEGENGRSSHCIAWRVCRSFNLIASVSRGKTAKDKRQFPYGLKIGRKRLKTKFDKRFVKVNDGDGVMILTDVLGGTATNLSLSFLENEKVELVTGVNMPMLLTLSSYRKGKSLKEIGRLVKMSGRRSIILAKELLESKRMR